MHLVEGLKLTFIDGASVGGDTGTWLEHAKQERLEHL